MHMPLVLTNRRRRGGSASAPAFSPTSLYSSGSQGIWLDPSDLSTMFSDRAGTTPVTTPGTVVGLRLDKSKGLVLGAELVTNGDFASGSAGYVEVLGGTISYASQTMLATATTGNTGVYRDVTVVANKSYQVAWRQVSGTNIRMNIYDGAGFGTSLFNNGTGDTIVGNRVAVLRPSSTTLRIYAHTPTGSTAEFDNISVRELAGNHAVAPTDAARPIYGVEPKGGRRNLLTWSEGFNDSVWTKDGSTITADFGTAPDSTATADRMVTGSTASTQKRIRGDISLSAGTHTISAHVKDNGGAARTVLLYLGNTADANAAGLSYDFTTDAITSVSSGSGFSVVANSRSLLPNGWIRLVAAVSIASAQTVRISLQAPFGGAQAADNLIWGAQLELGSTATAYQRVLSAYDITESGVPSCHYVQYDGSDDSMSTAAIDFTGTDKMSVFAGVRKLSDAFGIFAEISSGGAIGSWTMAIPEFATPRDGYTWETRGAGSAQVLQVDGLPLPTSLVITGLSNLAAPSMTTRANGIQTGASTPTLGGNFGNHLLYIGRRTNSTFPFNGRDYGIIVVGKAASAGEITDTELWLSDKTAEVDVAKSISPNIYTRSGDTILDRANSIIERRTV